MPTFLIAMLVSAGISAVAGGLSSWQRSSQNRRRAEGIETAIDRIWEQDTTSAPINAASRQIGGQSAAAGLAGSGIQSAAAAEAAASITAQDIARRQGLEAQLRMDPNAVDPGSINPGLDGFLGALGGGAAGAGQAYGAYLGTEAGAANPWPMGNQGAQRNDLEYIFTPWG